MADSPPSFIPFGTNAPDMVSFSSLIASLASDNAGATNPPQSPSIPAVTPSAQTADTSSTAQITSERTPSTFSTVPSSSKSSSSSGSSSIGSTGSGSSTSSSTTASSLATAAVGSDSNAATVQHCSSITCSAGLKAAVAVPVVVGALVIIGLCVFLLKRRRRRSDKSARQTETLSEKPKKKWTRHLRIFSFDAELLMGGRFSSSNSMHSGNGSQRHVNNPSIHSAEDATPPYRDAVSHAQTPMTQTRAAAGAGGLAAGAATAAVIPRPDSRASAPPPYSQTERRPDDSPRTPVAATANPFSDSNPITPVEGASPFRDPSDDGRSARSRPTLSRNSSVHTGLGPDDHSVAGGSDYGSIREAQVGRHVSVTSAGRTVTNIRNSSQSPHSQSPPASD